MIRLKNEKDLQQLRMSGRILVEILSVIKREARVGARLSRLDKIAREMTKAAGVKPTFLGYRTAGMRKAYPAAICASINDTVVHGLPSDYALRNGDVLKIDFSVNYKGYITDAAITFGIGEISSMAEKMIAVARESLVRGIEAAKNGGHLGDIGYAIDSVVKSNKFKVIVGLTGHGVGFELHEDPVVLNCGKRGSGIELQPGLVLAIEPMISAGSPHIKQKFDESYATIDGSLSAHFEATVALTPSGAEILTPIFDL